MHYLVLSHVVSGGGFEFDHYTRGVFNTLNEARQCAFNVTTDSLRWANEWDHISAVIELWENEKKTFIEEYHARTEGDYTRFEGTVEHLIHYINTFFPGFKQGRTKAGDYINLAAEGQELVVYNEKGVRQGVMLLHIRELDEMLKDYGFMKLCRFCMNEPEPYGQDSCNSCQKFTSSS